MKLEMQQIQSVLNEMNVSGWLLYDFHGQNPIAREALALETAHITRRWFYYVPAQGSPILIHHAIEAAAFPADIPGERISYDGQRTLEQTLSQVLESAFAVAMEYHPRGAIPYLSRVDAGTVEWVRSMDVNVVSSSPLVSALAAWTPTQLESHQKTARMLEFIASTAFDFVEARLRTDEPLYEHEVQAHILKRFEADDLITDHPPIVASGKSASDPHHSPSADHPVEIAKNSVLMIDLWAREDAPITHSAYADLTFMAWVGPDAVPEHIEHAFRAVVAARDAALTLAQSRHAEGEVFTGAELDTAARRALHNADLLGFARHRTGHNLGIQSAHGNGPHLDAFETRDDREIGATLAFTIEPGVYVPDANFGIRSEIDVYVDPEAGPVVYTTPQDAWRIIDPDIAEVE